MKTIGLVGGVASGKSLAAKALADLGATVLDADRTGHAVLAEDPDVRKALVVRWGPGILSADGKVDRAALALRIFADNETGAADREFLEEQLHPRIRQRLIRERGQAAAAGKPAVVLDAPLLLEAGWGPMCDFILMVDSSRELRLQRAKARDWTEAEFDRREAAQWPVDEKRRHANIVVPNRGSADELRAAIAGFWEKNIATAFRSP